MPGPSEINEFHNNDDVDVASISHHHTLGVKPAQAAAGNHDHVKVYTTTGRPSSSTVKVGYQIWDSTLNKPLWADGANWRDATGTAV